MIIYYDHFGCICGIFPSEDESMTAYRFVSTSAEEVMMFISGEEDVANYYIDADSKKITRRTVNAEVTFPSNVFLKPSTDDTDADIFLHLDFVNSSIVLSLNNRHITDDNLRHSVVNGLKSVPVFICKDYNPNYLLHTVDANFEELLRGNPICTAMPDYLSSIPGLSVYVKQFISCNLKVSK